MTTEDSLRAFRSGTFENLVRKLERGVFVDGETLADVLRANPDKPLPPPVLDYLCRTLEGRVSRPRGRKPGGTVQALRNAYAVILYERYLAWLKRRKRRFGLSECPDPQGLHWWQGSPHERAARMVARQLFPNHTWEHVRNLVSSRK